MFNFINPFGHVGARPTCSLTETNFTTFNRKNNKAINPKPKGYNKIKKNNQEKCKQQFLAASLTT
jgi:hypothetical protein